MATRFSCIYPAMRGDEYRVYIDDAEFVGSATDIDLSEGGFSLRMEGDSRDMYAPILGSKVTVPVAVTDDTLADFEAFAAALLVSSEQRFTVRIDYRTSSLGSWALY